MSKCDELMKPLPADARDVFRTNTSDSQYWRSLLAYDPMETFSLNDLADLDQLETFFQRNSQRLCAGYLSYDLGLKLLAVDSRHASRQPLALFHAYDKWYEGETGTWQSSQRDHAVVLPKTLPGQSETQLDEPLLLEPSLSAERYRSALDKIHNYIRAGDFYQINMTQQLRGTTNATSRALFSRLLANHPAAHTCYLETQDLTIHSLSPELFLHHANGILTTEPIKGTRPRGSDPEADARQREELLASSKEQAELFMITDLMRNDLGQVCEVGSIQLDAVKEIRQLPRVWHTLSRLTGDLLQTLSPLAALLSMFPGGSITGCPKKRAVEIIDELELSSRGIYTGSIGYLHPDGDMSFNIAIRTLIQQGNQLSLGTGGGITIDSNWEDEWQELLVKASTFM